jgi:hypothetical protein
MVKINIRIFYNKRLIMKIRKKFNLYFYSSLGKGMENSIIVMENDMKVNLGINKCKNENLEFL